MEAQNLKTLHKEADKDIKKLSSDIFKANPGDTYKITDVIAKKIGATTGQTVRNYCKGGGKDGFMKIVIIEALKNY